MAGSLDPWGTNPHGVTVDPIDWDANDAPYAKTYHGLTIVSNGQLIGRITSWNPSELARENVLVYELSYYTFGRPVDQVPGRATGYTVSGTSAEMWDGEIEKRFEGDQTMMQYADLMDQKAAFTVYEHWFKGIIAYKTWVYYGCWFTAKGDEAYSAEGDARVTTNFTLQYVSRRATL